MVLLFVLTLCGSPHMVLMVDEGKLYQGFYKDLDPTTVSIVADISGKGKANIVEIWAGKCA